jgi:hypothetical protein
MEDQFPILINNLRVFDTEAEVEQIVEANKDRLNELQQEQLAAGVDATGQKRIDEYRPLTKELKRKFGVGLGAVTDRVTFFMTGKLYNSLHAEVAGGQYEVKSPLPTFDKMVERIGKDKYGLSPDQREEFATEITVPEFVKVWEQKTGLKT